MIRQLIINLIVFVLILPLPAATVARNDMTRAIALQGSVGNVAKIQIDPIVSQSQGFAIGIPFNIQEPLVQYDGSGNGFGRAIAHWSAISNTDFILKIEAQQMQYVDKASLEEEAVSKLVPLDYRLKLNYNMGYYYNGTLVETGNRLLTIDTYTNTQDPAIPSEYRGARGENIFIFDLFDGIGDQPTTGVRGCVDGTIYFMFADEQSTAIDDDAKTRPGNYEAVVTFTMEAI